MTVASSACKRRSVLPTAAPCSRDPGGLVNGDRSMLPQLRRPFRDVTGRSTGQAKTVRTRLFWNSYEA